MAIEIEKNNNKELVPLEHYLEEYKKSGSIGDLRQNRFCL